MLTDAQREDVQSGIKQVEESMPFSLVSLTSIEVQRLAKAGPLSADFVMAGLELAIRNPELLTANRSVEELENQKEFIRNLDKVEGMLNSLAERVDSTLKVAKADAYQTALTTYALAKRNKASGIVADYDRMAQRFKKQGARKKNTKSEPQTLE
jgi:ATP phosphoribosyltransferase regulatory subunit HisZ